MNKKFEIGTFVGGALYGYVSIGIIGLMYWLCNYVIANETIHLALVSGLFIFSTYLLLRTIIIMHQINNE